LKIKTNQGEVLNVRPVSAADAGRIADLFNAVFQERSLPPFSTEEWTWKYLKGPASKPELCFVAERENGELVGHLGNWLFRGCMLGRPILVSHWLDAMIHPEMQRSGILVGMFESYFNALKAAGVPVSIALPNEKSVVSHQARARFMFMLRNRRLTLGSARHDSFRAAIAVEEEDRFCTEFLTEVSTGTQEAPNAPLEELLTSCRNREFLSIWKDCAHFRWKYENSPRRELYKLFGTRIEANGYFGFAVVRERNGVAQILEIHSREKSVTYARELIHYIADHYQKTRDDIHALTFVGRDHWYFDPIFGEFDETPAFEHFFFARSTDPSQAFLYEGAENWTLTFSDSDEI
jgi:hypothetical protein